MRPRTNVKRTITVLGVAAALGASGLLHPVSSGAAKPLRAEEADFQFVATHPWAAAQPTENGRKLRELEVHDGRVWAGYGDYSRNTGPIMLASLTTGGDAGFEAEFMADTEAVHGLRVHDGQVVAPATDPRVAADFAMGDPWTQARPLGATHVFDSASPAPGELWMVGSQDVDAVAWRSVDDGATWTEVLRDAPTSGEPAEFMRYYFAGVIDGAVYVQAVSSHEGPRPTAQRFDGGAWAAAPSMIPSAGSVGWEPIPYQGGLLYRGGGTGTPTPLYFYDRTQVRELGDAFDVAVDGDYAYRLEAGGTVTRTDNLKSWRRVLQAPATASSLAVADGSVWVGTTTAELWHGALPTSKGNSERGGRP